MCSYVEYINRAFGLYKIIHEKRKVLCSILRNFIVFLIFSEKFQFKFRDPLIHERTTDFLKII